jgi:adenosyl cobinamide kinase/adenosyl cobinamide phosphate guanylyltransferase
LYGGEGGTEPEDANAAQAALDEEIESLLAAYEACRARWLIVSNEVGLGLVPPYPLGRIFSAYCIGLGESTPCQGR